MRSIWTIAGAVLIAAACSTPASFPRALDRVPDPEGERRDAEIRRLTAARIVHARELAQECLPDSLPSLPEAEQRATIARCRGLSMSVLADRAPGDLAALAPKVLRVYDLGPMLDDGPDGENVDFNLVERRDDDAIDGAEALLVRVARNLRESEPALWDGDTFVEAVGEHLLVLQRPEVFEVVERDLDRLATVGGGFARVRVIVVEATDVEAGPSQWAPADFQVHLASAATSNELTVDVPFGRLRGAFDGVQSSYVQDFDVDAPSGLADPVIGTLRTGTAVSATYGASDRDGRPRLELQIARSVAVDPIPEFTTLIEPGASPVTIQLPEVRAVSLADRVTPTAAGGARAALARNIDVDDDTTAGVRVVVHTQAFGNPGAALPGWTRVRPTTASRALDAPLLEQATPLAALHLEKGDERRAEAEIRFALTHAEGRVWRKRLRVSPDVAEGVLVRWPSPATDAETKRALRESSVEEVAGCGFVTVTDGLVIAYVTPQSAGSIARTLGSLRRRVPDTQLHVAFDGTDDDDLRCAATDQISFVQDFDVEVAAGAAIADPIIGVMQQGAVAEALHVPTEGAGTYDVRLTHARADAPIREFTTSLSRGSPVTLQLPRLHIRTTWRRAVLQRGESVELETRIGSGESEDVRRFVLRAAD